MALDDRMLVANSVDDLVARYASPAKLEAIEIDRGREIGAREEKQVKQVKYSWEDRPIDTPVSYTVLEIPLVPKGSNERMVQLRADTWPVYLSGDVTAEFRPRDHIVVLRDYTSGIEQAYKLIQERISALNSGLLGQTSSFENQIKDLISAQKSEASKRRAEFDQRLKAMGIDIQQRPNAVAPLNLEVRQEIRVLRQPTHSDAGPPEDHLTPESVAAIVGLIETMGRGYEVAPAVYAKLGEEDLRQIILSQLNAVLTFSRATGETFSRKGKTDILISLPTGAILVGECKFWGGSTLYGATLEQLFGYLTFRHTTALMITFVKAKDLTNVVQQAQQKIITHSSYQGEFFKDSETHLTSTHVHPVDRDKKVVIHHLFFHLYAG